MTQESQLELEAGSSESSPPSQSESSAQHCQTLTLDIRYLHQIIWQNYVHRPRNYREAAEKASSQKIQRQPIVWNNRDELEFSWILMLKNMHID